MWLRSKRTKRDHVASKPSAWAAKREGTLNQFFTREGVGELLIRELGSIEPRSVIDLGAGEGSLAAAVAKHWPTAHITTVDVDASCAGDLHKALVAAGATDHEHQVLDVLKSSLPAQLGKRLFDLAVCNPPFFRPAWEREFADILRDADLAEACPSLPEATAEILFLAQNVRLIRDGGTIALIVPDGLATGWRALAFRRALLKRYTLRAVAQLPPYSFMDTEAYCFILVIDKKSPVAGDKVRLLRLEEDGSVAKTVNVELTAAEARLDYTYHALAQSNPSGATTLRQLGADIRRGSLSSVERKSLDAFVFHTGDFPARAKPVRLESALPDTNKRLVVAEKGDILMARVDRELHDKVTFVSSGQAAITDCVYRVRLPEQHRQLAFEALSSDYGRARIQAVTKGVGARLLGKGDLLDIPLVVTSA